VLIEREHKEERQAAKVAIQALKAKLKVLRDAAKTNEEFNGLIQADHRRMDVMLRAFRGIFSSWGLYSGTYLIIEEAARRARSGRYDPARPRWDGTGCLGVQIQGGASAADVLSGKNHYLRIAPVNRAGKGRRWGSQTTAQYRIRSRDKKPVFITLPLAYHRDLPEDARITWVRLVVAKSGLRKIYSLNLTLESKTFQRQEFGAGTVAICLNQDRILYAAEGEEPVELSFDPRLGKADDLQSIRDKNRNGAIGLLRAWCERQDEVPDWFLDELEKNTANASCRRAVGLVYRLERERLLPDALMATLKEWVAHEDHLYQWQSDLRGNALRARKYTYRCFAAHLRRTYRDVLLDSRRLDGTERKSKERNDMGFYELKLAIRHSMGAEHVHDVTGATCEEMFQTYYEEKQREEERARKALEKLQAVEEAGAAE
jgi:hypothetical protein